MNINIRKATDKDSQVLYSLIKEFAANLDKSEMVKTRIEDFEREINHYECLLAENEKGKIMGYALFVTSFHSWSGKSVHLDDLYVRKEYRCMSVGTMLACAVIDYSKRNGCNDLRWLLQTNNKDAVQFYKKLGATISDDRLFCIYSFK